VEHGTSETVQEQGITPTGNGRNMYQGRLRQSGKASMELSCANIDHVYARTSLAETTKFIILNPIQYHLETLFVFDCFFSFFIYL